MNSTRARAIINLDNIEHNYNYLKQKAGQNVKVMAVVKADAYGHGAVEVCKRLLKSGADYFAVACTAEAAALREGGVTGNILILGITPVADADILEKYDLIQTVNSAEYASGLAQRARVRVHIKADTGMSRLGIYCHKPEDAKRAADEILKISEIENIKIEGIFTHFAASDEPDNDFTQKQYEAFTALLDELKQRNIDCGIRHCCNSAAILNYPNMYLDMVRAGIALYGFAPSPDTEIPYLQPAMSFRAGISQIAELRPGDTVSYGCSFTVEKPVKAAVISAGYADGLFRGLSGKWDVVINGKKARLLGKICMDLCIADVTDIECKPGDDAVIFGNENTVDEMAKVLNTINYELLCSLKNRVTREYIYTEN